MGAKNLGKHYRIWGRAKESAPPASKGGAGGLIYPAVQPGREARPNGSKENQIKTLAFPWIHLVELGLINKLGIKN
jgi:hypothetical protein